MYNVASTVMTLCSVCLHVQNYVHEHSLEMANSDYFPPFSSPSFTAHLHPEKSLSALRFFCPATRTGNAAAQIEHRQS